MSEKTCVQTKNVFGYPLSPTAGHDEWAHEDPHDDCRVIPEIQKGCVRHVPLYAPDEAGKVEGMCEVPPPGWVCTRAKGHDGPCAAVPESSPAEVASVVPNITGERADVYVFQSVCIASTEDAVEAFRLRDAINAEAETWLFDLHMLPRRAVPPPSAQLDVEKIAEEIADWIRGEHRERDEFTANDWEFVTAATTILRSHITDTGVKG